ncbi:hypothetical protein BD413DRAFT_495812 [Trametes elegans]|nr:hypothetical protein BD413DRAFT_495812 [Trametes elegans]
MIPVASLLQHGPKAPISQAEKAVKQALDSLVMTGALQTTNRMDINSLLNPQVKTEVFSEVSEEEIFEAVQVARNASDNGDASDDIGELAVEKPPTRAEVLQAASVILRFSSMLDDTAARKMESALASFTRQTRLDAQRAIKDTTITRYFSRQ